MDLSWEWLSACHSAVCCQGESAVLLGSMCPPVPSQAWWCPVGHPWPSLKGLEDAIMARDATWGPWPPPHAHGSAQQQCPSAQAGLSKGLGQPMTPGGLCEPYRVAWLVNMGYQRCGLSHCPPKWPWQLPGSYLHDWKLPRTAQGSLGTGPRAVSHATSCLVLTRVPTCSMGT